MLGSLNTIFLKVDVENYINLKFAEFCLSINWKKVGQNSANLRVYIGGRGSKLPKILSTWFVHAPLAIFNVPGVAVKSLLNHYKWSFDLVFSDLTATPGTLGF